ncbi:MAG: HAD family hydrolase [Simkaniaceae bacterium]|nr:HAD family hydrolase [Simkaniaceae bacterium]
MNRGTIALDIDGTITNREHQIPDGVCTYFENLYKKGWQFIFVTGRPLSFAMMTLPKLSFPYLLGLQNGADLIEIPSKKKVARSYLKIDAVELLDQLYEGNEGDFIVYAGYEKGDLCYFRPHRFSKKMQEYLKEIEKLSAAPWIPLDSFAIKEQTTFPLIKCIGSKEMLEGLNEKLSIVEDLKTTVVKDPISSHLYFILITHKNADKGIAVNTFMEKYQLKHPLITGGDDNNDLPLLKVGDVRIAMDGAPQALQNIAQIIAPPADRMGIIQGIEEAIELGSS